MEATGLTPTPGSEMTEYYKEKYIQIEYKHLPKFVPSGIYVLPSFDSLLVWNGLLFVRAGPYKGALIVFKIFLPPSYPQDPPTIRLVGPSYHPHVHPDTGDLDCRRLRQSWKPNANFIWELLVHLKKIFYQIEVSDPASCYNPQAARMFKEQPEIFFSKVKEFVHATQSASTRDSFLHSGSLPPKTEQELKELLFAKTPKQPLVDSLARICK